MNEGYTSLSYKSEFYSSNLIQVKKITVNIKMKNIVLDKYVVAEPRR